MKTTILYILCEGQTEERFVKEVLKDYLASFGVVCKTRILLTSKQKNCRGGMLSYQQVKTDLNIMFKQHPDDEHNTYFFTTMFDLYKLPTDFPYSTTPFNDIYDKVNQIEDAFAQDINATSRFIPYIQLHEYEALVFAGLDFLEAEYPKQAQLHKNIGLLKKELAKKHDNPELINTTKAPSKYIIDALEGIHHYNKPKIGSTVAAKVTIPILKTKCKHFADWIEKLERLNQA